MKLELPLGVDGWKAMVAPRCVSLPPLSNDLVGENRTGIGMGEAIDERGGPPLSDRGAYSKMSRR